jgi:hypothetical protein
MANTLNRRKFSMLAASAGLGSYLLPFGAAGLASAGPLQGKKVGIIGLDTSHSIAFTKELNNPTANPDWAGYRVVAAYPKGSNDIETSVKRIPGYIEEVKKLGVEIADSIDDLLRKVDVVMLETNDGRLHREQVAKVFAAGKRVFIDKPIAASLTDTIAIFDLAKKKNIPVFSASSLRYIKGMDSIDKSLVVGADTYSPAVLEKTHPDLFWYGIHGVETLFTAMGTGCQSVTRVHTPDTDIVIGTWSDGRVGTFRGTRTGKHEYGGTVYTKNGNVTLGPYAGYNPLLKDIIHFFETGETPVKPEETIEIFAFMEAADESKRQGGVAVSLASVLKKAQKS